MLGPVQQVFSNAARIGSEGLRIHEQKTAVGSGRTPDVAWAKQRIHHGVLFARRPIKLQGRLLWHRQCPHCPAGWRALTGTTGKSMNEALWPPRATLSVTSPWSDDGMRRNVPLSAPAIAIRKRCPALKLTDVA